MCMGRAGQSRVYAPHITVYLVIFCPEKPYKHRIYMANPMYMG